MSNIVQAILPVLFRLRAVTIQQLASDSGLLSLSTCLREIQQAVQEEADGDSSGRRMLTTDTTTHCDTTMFLQYGTSRLVPPPLRMLEDEERNRRLVAALRMFFNWCQVASVLLWIQLPPHSALDPVIRSIGDSSSLIPLTGGIAQCTLRIGWYT